MVSTHPLEDCRGWNRSQRLQFDVPSSNGILLFREASKMLVGYGKYPSTRGLWQMEEAIFSLWHDSSGIDHRDFSLTYHHLMLLLLVSYDKNMMGLTHPVTTTSPLNRCYRRRGNYNLHYLRWKLASKSVKVMLHHKLYSYDLQAFTFLEVYLIHIQNCEFTPTIYS